MWRFAVLLVACALPAAMVPGAAAQQGGEGGGGEPGPPRLAAKAWVLIDAGDEEVLAARAAGRRLPIASATKLMTARLALERLRPKQSLVAPPYQALAAESLLGLRAGERMTVRDLLYALILASANDAAVTIARGVSGKVQRFVRLMNREAASLGLDDTSFANPIGLDAPGNYSSAADLAELTDELLEDRLFARISDSASATLRSGDRTRRISSRNRLLAAEPSIDGVKTGHTLGAGYVLVGSATRDGTRLIAVVLGTGSESARDAETLKLLNYGFSLYGPSRPVRKREELAEVDLEHRDDDLALVAARGIRVSAREGQVVATEVDAPDEVSGAVGRGERLGRVVVTIDGVEAGSAPLVAARSASEATFADRAVAAAQNPSILIPAGAFVIVVGVLLAVWRHGRRTGGRASGRSGPRERERTPEERQRMHHERMRRRREEAVDE